MLLMALVAPWAANAQLTHTVCNGTDTRQEVPIFGYYVDHGTKTEFIIPSVLINPMHSEGGCYITKMTFYLGQQASKAWNASFRVFIKNYGNSQFNDASFVGDAGATTVYTGVLNANSSTMEVVFDQYFHYDGQSNLLIGLYWTGAGQSAQASFLGQLNSTVNRAINAFDEDGTGYNDPLLIKFTPKVTFDYIQTPTNVQVISTPGSGVTVSWEGTAPSFNIEYENMESIFSYFDGYVNTTGNSYTFTDSQLVSGMKYRYRVQAQYTPELTSNWSDWVTYTDCPNYLDLPLHANFDYMPVPTTNTVNNLPGCWTYINNSTDPDYQIYPLVENNSSLCHSNYYPQGQYNYVRFNMPTGNNGGVDQYLIFPPVDVTSSGGVELKFWVRNVDEHSTYCQYAVGLIDNPLSPSNFYIKDNYGGYSTTYEQKTVAFTQQELQTNGNYIVIMAQTASDWPVSFCIDDIDIYPANYHCGEPVNVHAESITTNSALIVWQNPETGGGEFGLKYKKASDSEWTMVYENGITSHSWTLNSLEEYTHYNVAVINHCNGIDHSEWTEASFTTLATPILINEYPWTENFDSYTPYEGLLPISWNRINTGTVADYNMYPYVIGSDSHSASNCLQFYSGDDSGVADQYVVFPEMTALAGGEISFWAKGFNAYYTTFKVGGMTDPNDPTTFIEFSSNTLPGTYTKYTVTIPTAYLGHYLALMMKKPTSSNWAGAYIDDITFEFPKPTNLAVSYASASSALATWTAGGNETQWQIAYKKASDTEWTEVPNRVDQRFYTLGLLDPDTEYQVKVRGYYGDLIGYSAWTEPVSYTTPAPCVAITDYPWSENFDSYTPSEGFLPGCWNRINMGTNTTYNKYPYVVEGDAHSDYNCLKFYSWGNTGVADQYVVLPEMTGLAGGEVSFWAKGLNTYSRIYVGIMTDPSNISTFIPFASESLSTTYYDYTYSIPTIPEYQGNYVAIMVPKPTSSGYVGAYIDDITVSAAVPSDVNVTGIAGTSATISWTENGTATAWQICLNDDITNLIAADSNPFTLTGLTPATAYNVKVRACYSATQMSNWSASYDFTTLLQDPFVVDATHSYTDNFDGELNWVLINGSCGNYWKLGTDEHLDDGTTSGMYSGNALFIANDTEFNGGYGYDISSAGSTVYACKVFTLQAETYYYSYNWRCYGEENYDFLRVALAPASTALTAGVYNQPFGFGPNGLPSGWIDLDGGSQPNLSNTWATIAKHPTGSNYNLVNSIEITNPGDYMVVFIWHNGNEGGTQYPAAIDNFSLSLPCPKPTDLTYYNRTNNSVTLDWESNGAHHSWQIAVDDGSGYHIAGGTATKPYTLVGLTPGTTYRVKVVALLTQGVFSSYSNEVTFTTKQNAEIVDNTFTDNFESTNSYWLLVNGSATNKWVKGTAVNHGGTHALYVSNDGGTTNAYTFSQPSTVYATKMLQFNKGVYRFSYDWRALGESSYDYMRVVLVPGDVELKGDATGSRPQNLDATHVPDTWIALDGGSKLNQQDAWQTASFDVAVPAAGDYMMVFVWYNDILGGTNPPAAVDNVSIQYLGSVFATSGDWDDADNWIGGLIPTSTDDVIVRAEATIQNGTVAFAKNISFDASAASHSITVADGGLLTVAGTINNSEYANLVINDGGQVKCNNTFHGTMKKNITGYGSNTNSKYYLIGTPKVVYVHGQLLTGLNADKADVYRFDGINQGEEWIWTKGVGPTVVGGAHRGFLFAYQDDCVLSITSGSGPFRATNADVTVNGLSNNNILSTPTTWGSHNLIGNPYTCNAYLADGRPFYRMNADGDAIILATDNAIKPLEGVFIVFGAEETTANSVTFTTTQPTQANTEGALNISLSQAARGEAATLDAACIRFGEGQSLPKFYFMGNTSGISIPQEGKDYAVVRSNAQNEMPINFKAGKNGTYTLSVNPENVEMGYLHLIDNMTGADVNLLVEPIYSFEARTNDYSSRFRLVFNANGSSTDSETDETFAYNNGSEWVILNEGEATLQVIDVLGHQLSSEESHSEFRIPNFVFSMPGVYVLRLINGDSVRTQKVVVR